MNGSKIKLITADNPEILFNTKTVNHTVIKLAPSVKLIAKSEPKEVATPLPPSNLLKIENICPARIKNEIKYNKVRSISASKNIGMKPFKKSPINVITPAKGPATLYIFVAPGFFEPACLGSSVDIRLCTISANGRDPTK